MAPVARLYEKTLLCPKFLAVPAAHLIKTTRMSIARLSARHLSTSSGGLFPISAHASALLEGDDERQCAINRVAL